MIVAIALADGQVIALSADHILMLSDAEGGKDSTEITMVNGKKFVVRGKVQDLTHRFNNSR